MLHKQHLTTHRELPYFRRPKTQNEKRQSLTADDLPMETITHHQAAHIIRAARRAAALADAWDDKPVSLWKNSHFLRTWKANKDKFR